MSDNERMDRAKRIRQMREGQRDDEESDDETTADGGGTTDLTESESEAPDTDQSTPGTDGTETPPDGDAAEDSTAATGTEHDGETTEAVDAVSGTTATIPDVEEMEAALEETMEQAELVEGGDAEVTDTTEETEGGEDETEDTDEPGAAGPAGVAGETATQEAETRVLEFRLDDEQYCLDIEYIEEIVKHEHITRVPNTPEFVEGVVDLRGQITTILNPKVTIGKDDQTAGDLIVVFDSEAFDDQGHIGWVVDDVRQVSPVTDDQVNDPPMGEEYINGVIDREDDEFVIWTTPNLALEEAE